MVVAGSLSLRGLTSTMTCPSDLFTYEDGRLYWAVSRGGVKVGQRAGSVCKDGYRRVRVNGKRPMEHRVIYEMHHGPIPKGFEIDHINGDRSDNRIENLRVATPSENQHNQKSVKGFYFHKRDKKFIARIKADGKQIHIGHYETEELAREAYLEAKAKYHPTSPIVQAAARS